MPEPFEDQRLELAFVASPVDDKFSGGGYDDGDCGGSLHPGGLRSRQENTMPLPKSETNSPDISNWNIYALIVSISSEWRW